jgi:hypothetical protein
MSISRRAALNPAHSHALLLCISSVSGNKIVAAALLRHAQRSARLPCSTPTAVEGGVALKPHACRRISRQSAASRALAAETRSRRSWSGERTAKGGEGVQWLIIWFFKCLARMVRGIDVIAGFQREKVSEAWPCHVKKARFGPQSLEKERKEFMSHELHDFYRTVFGLLLQAAAGLLLLP